MKSNQKNLGTIKSSNLCAEIIIYSDKNEYGVCVLASIGLPKYVSDQRVFDHKKLYEVTKIVVKNLNSVTDKNFYPTKEARDGNLKHRPIGVGVQGLADVFIKMRLPYESEEAKKLNAEIFETIQFAALESSMELATADGPYESFHGSPSSEGQFQHDLWKLPETNLSGMYDWDELRKNVMQFGLRNSLVTCCMPTASTSQILGNTESIEPITSNFFMRKTLSGDFAIINKYLISDLLKEGIWCETLKNKIIRNDGSVQGISEINPEIQLLYKTAWEIKQRSLIDLSAGRGPFVDQSQSLNIFMATPTFSKLSSMLFHGWKAGLKTSSYYLRIKASSKAAQMTVQEVKKIPDQCFLENPESCEMCSG